jgi:hypothetical protein
VLDERRSHSYTVTIVSGVREGVATSAVTVIKKAEKAGNVCCISCLYVNVLTLDVPLIIMNTRTNPPNGFTFGIHYTWICR